MKANSRATAGGQAMRFGVFGTRIGRVFVAATDRGLAALLFLDGDTLDPALERLALIAPGCSATEDAPALRRYVEPVTAWLDGGDWPGEVPLDLRGTAFQREVWEALRAIPEGETRSYGAIAASLGRPKASRAVGAACGANPVSILVPCHRAVGARGDLVNYRWGLDRKRALLARESPNREVERPRQGSMFS